MTHPQTEAKGADAKAAAMDAVGEVWDFSAPPDDILNVQWRKIPSKPVPTAGLRVTFTDRDEP